MEREKLNSYVCQLVIQGLTTVLILGCSLLMNTLNANAQVPEFDQRHSFEELVGDSRALDVGDIDGDGDLDILVLRDDHISIPRRLYLLLLNNGDGSFAAPISTGIPDVMPNLDSTDEASLADIDGDGDLDLIRLLDGFSTIYLNDSIDSFSYFTSHEVVAAVAEQTLGDVDADGDFDIVVYGTNQNYQLYTNNGGDFTPSQPFETGDPNIRELALIDVNGDHALDLIAIGDEIKIYQNDGQATFSLLSTLDNANGYNGSTDVTLGDLDGDLDQDMAIAHDAQQSLLFFNDGHGNFPISRTLGTTNTLITRLTLGDVDTDGDLDIAAIAAGQSTIFINDGAGTFSQLPHFSSIIDLTQAVGLGDIDGDSDLDLIAVGSNGQNLLYINNGAGKFTIPHPFGEADVNASQVEVGDLNGDQHLDLIVAGDLYNNASNVLYFGNGTGSFPTSATFGSPTSIYSIAIGDMDGDHDLDLVAGGSNATPSLVYLNVEAGNLAPYFILDRGQYSELVNMIVRVGDLDNDGDLDIVEAMANGYSGGFSTYLNDGGGNFLTSRLFGTFFNINAIALGDMDNDGDLDLVTTYDYFGRSHPPDVNSVYLNDGQGNFIAEISFGRGADRTQDLALADVDGDGALDVIAANAAKQASIYRNDGHGNLAESQALGSWLDAPQHVATADVDDDGDFDIVADGNSDQNFIYLNDNLGKFSEPIIFSGTLTNFATGDMDGDGAMDIATVNNHGQGMVYLNRKSSGQILTKRPGNTPLADSFSTTEILVERLIPISYTLTSPNSLAFGSISAFYSLNGGGKWLPAIASQETLTRNLTASPNGVEHLFYWDTFASGFFGQSDNVVVRLIAYSQPLSTTTPLAGTYRYTNTTPGPYQYPYVSATTFPFRVRGTQVRVVDGQNVPVPNALVYRLPKGSVGGAELMSNANQPLTTASNGYLGGRGVLAIGDQLLAMVPITHNLNYTLYATSGIPNENGLTMSTVSQAGVQTLQVSLSHPLLLFDLDVSLEWDASNDGLFYQQLTTAFERASDILYDVSDGQIALGEVRIHPNREAWLSADVVIYANNNLRPRATMGGLVESSLDETHGLRGVLPNAYTPGQVRMGPIWDPFGQNFAELTQDWQRALAHELAHYLLYLPDNYLGVEKGILRITNCQGSLMTDAYNPDYSEFLTPGEWAQTPGNPCLRTVAATLLTGRSDWATVTHFYPQLITPTTKLTGPALLPLHVTRVQVVTSTTVGATPVPARNYDLRNEAGNVTVLRQAQAYLLQGQDTDTSNDDSLLYLGSTGVGSDRILVRGALAGDKVCVIDNDSEPVRAGCERVTAQSTSIQVHAVPGWRPDIQISPVTSTTFQITVTQVGNVGQLSAQLLPAYASNTASAAIQSITSNLTSVAGTPNYTATVTLAYPTFEGFVRVYSASNSDRIQSITQFFLSGDWGPPNAWSGRVNRAWGANSRSLEAPVASGDGKVTILNLSDLLADTGDTTLQAVNDLPNLPIWLAPVGSGYRIRSSKDLTRTLMFQYNQRDVPPGYEQTLTLYYLPAGANDWQRLSTGPLTSGVDSDDNLATVIMPHANRGDGIYALMATVQLQPLFPGWNPLTYPVGAAQSVTNALASLDGTYTTVYGYQRGTLLPWPLFDRTVDPAFAPLVNTLQTLQFGHNYLIYATGVVTPYIGVVGDGHAASVMAATAPDELIEPPATFYGFVTGQNGNSLREGMTIRARIGSVVCGESRLQSWQDHLAYVIQVKVDSGDGCGQVGRTVNFEIDGKPSLLIATWDDRQVTQILSGRTLYFPIIAR